MKELETLFENKHWDIEQPDTGHRNRFSVRLQEQQNVPKKTSTINYWKYLAIAASIVLLITVYIPTSVDKSSKNLAEVSTEMADVENYYNSSIQHSVKLLGKQNNTEHKIIITEAINEVQRLEKDYQKLSTDLFENTDSPKIIQVMILNLQQRLDVLQRAKEQIEYINQQTKNSYESKI